MTYDQQSKEIIPEVILTEEVCSTTVPMEIGEVYAKKGKKGKKGHVASAQELQGFGYGTEAA